MPLHPSPFFSVLCRGLASSLHVIIFDEFDSIGRTRGSSRDASGVRDSCVNQLLTLLDGTRQMSNVLVIALTNRKDMVDPALLRPGRLEVHIEIGLPSEEGRKEILKILFAPLLSGKYLSESDGSVWTDKIARLSQGASGADLSGIMRNAASHAIERWQAEHRYREGMLRLTVEKNTAGLMSQGQGQETAAAGGALYIDGRDPSSNLQYVWTDFETALLSLNS
jgi:SpoVK/Ycf46/Vps4 family AAA+-type ATPase